MTGQVQELLSACERVVALARRIARFNYVAAFGRDGRLLLATHFAATAICLVLSGSANASYTWSARAQVSHTDELPEDGAIVEWVSPGRADSVRAYAVIRPWEDTDPFFTAWGFQIALRPGSSWQSGWALRERFSTDANDHHSVVDRNDIFHVVHESYLQAQAIGYKNRGADNWDEEGEPIFITGDEGRWLSVQ
jgi:hypothetical protein